MSQNGRLGLIAVLAGALLVGAAGAVTAYQEFDVFAAGGLGPADRFAALRHGDYHDAPSILAKKLVLDACVEATNGIYGIMQASEDRTAMLTHCRSEADAIAAETPSSAYAHYVGALAAARLGDAEGFNSRILKAQITGPNEQWVAEQRVALVEDQFALATPEVLARHEADLRLLVVSGRGVGSISRRYVREPAFRERITAIVETMPEAEQAKFVARVRRAAEQVKP
jgi:hypothetical protein